jgi:hypothetical protein
VGEVAIPVRKSTSIAILVAGAFFMENLDGTVIATAIRRHQGKFQMGFARRSILHAHFFSLCSSI